MFKILMIISLFISSISFAQHSQKGQECILNGDYTPQLSVHKCNNPGTRACFDHNDEVEETIDFKLAPVYIGANSNYSDRKILQLAEKQCLKAADKKAWDLGHIDREKVVLNNCERILDLEPICFPYERYRRKYY